MGGYLDPSIALSYKPPVVTPPPDPLQRFGQVLQLRNMIEQGQMQQQQQQGLQLENQQRQMQIGATQAMNQAFQGAISQGPGGVPMFDTNAITTSLASKGYGSQIPGVVKNLTEAQQTAANLQKAKGEIAAQEADYVGSLGAAAKAANYDPSVLLLGLQHALALGYQSAGPAIQAIQADPTKTQAIADHLIAASPAQQKLANEATTAQAAQTRAGAAQTEAGVAGQRLTAELPGIAATNTVRQNEAAGTTPITPFQQAQLAGQAAERAQGAQRVAIEAQAQQLRQKQFDATYGSLLGPNGEQLTPEAQKAMAAADPVAVAVANYQVPPPNTGSRSPMALATLRKVMALNPDYNAQNWQAQSAMMKGYTSGSQSKEISGINTALGHIGVLGQAIDALNNNDIQGLNRLANFLQVQTGGTAVTTYQAIVHKVAPELNRAYVGGVGAQGEIQAQESDFDAKLGTAQLKNNVAITAQLLRSKIGSLENQWQQTMGPQANFQGRFIMPEAQQVINRYAPAASAAPAAGTPAPAAGRGGSGPAAPPLPASLGAGDVGKVYTNRAGQAVRITKVNPANPKQFLSEPVQ